jgi:hypothetical protein
MLSASLSGPFVALLSPPFSEPHSWLLGAPLTASFSAPLSASLGPHLLTHLLHLAFFMQNQGTLTEGEGLVWLTSLCFEKSKKGLLHKNLLI